MKTAILGDIGGQIEVFHEAIQSLGGNIDTGKLPEGLKLIQVGDIVRMSSSDELDSLACAEFADKLIDANEGNYVQLLGNHETPLLGGIVHPAWDVQALPESEPIINSWWDEKKAHIGVVLSKEGEKDIVITHAGLTHGFMGRLGVSTHQDAIALLNSYVGVKHITDIEHPGALVDGPTNFSADTFWALCGRELYDSWWKHRAGFNQVHGHSSIYRWEAREFWPDTPAYIKRNTLINDAERWSYTETPFGDDFRTVDWTLGNTRLPWAWPVFTLDGFEITTI